MSSFHMLILILSDYSKLVGEKTRESCRENENIKKKKKRGKERGDVEAGGGGCSEGHTLNGWKQ